MPHIKYVSNLLVLILVFIFVSFFYNGIAVRKANSLDYSIPMAKSLLSGEFLQVTSGDQFLYYPAAAYILLTPFVLVGFPNLFGVISWVFLFAVCKKLGDTFGLNTYMASIFAASVCTTMSVIRTLGDQSIDKWVCIWFVLSIILLEKPERRWLWSILLGLFLGLLIGSKYSGPFFLLALVPIYWKTFFKTLSVLRFLVASVIFTGAGLFWYIRNIVLTGSPYYPAKLPFLKGNPDYVPGDWMLWRVPIKYPESIPALLNAFLSEYMIWALSGIVILWFVVYSYRKKKVIESKIRRIIMLSITTGLASLFLPITPAHYFDFSCIVSNMRYIYILVSMLILAVFLIAKKYKQDALLATVALLNAMPIFTFIPYQPKIFIICFLFAIIMLVKNHVYKSGFS